VECLALVLTKFIEAFLDGVSCVGDFGVYFASQTLDLIAKLMGSRFFLLEKLFQ
jgi:hypothetical protein